jgi:hypothetical protein
MRILNRTLRRGRIVTTVNGKLFRDARSAAGHYLRLRRIPVPIPRTGGCKAPVLDRWPDLRPSDEDLDTLFPSDQALNIGLLLGEPSGGLIDIDLDAPEAVAIGRLLLPPTGWISGRRSKPRSHWWYIVNDPPDKASEEFHDLDAAKTMLLEVRSTRGQTVVPPSVHESGEEVVWHDFTQPVHIELDELQAAVRSVAAGALLARQWPGKNARQAAFLHLAGGLLRGGWSQQPAERFIEALAIVTQDEELHKRVQTVAQTASKLEQDKKVTGWPKLAELLGPSGNAVVQRARQWLGLVEATTPAPWPDLVPLGEVPDVLPFPLDVFPDVLQRFVREGAVALHCPADFLAVPLLVMAGAAIGASRALAIKRSHIQRASVYAAVIGSPGASKSPAQDLVVEPVHEIEERLHVAWQEAMKQYQADLEVYEEAKKDAKKQKTTPPEKPERPILERLTVNDATAEALVPILNENPRGIVLVRDELIAWVQAMNQYREGGKGADQQFWLSAWSGSTVTVDRKKTHELGPLRVRHPFISVIGGLVPDRLPTLRGDRPRQRIEHDGFIDRLLMSFPAEPQAAPENWLEVADTTLAGLRDVLDKLRSLEMIPVQEEEHKQPQDWRPFVVRLTATGKQAWQHFTQAHAAERNAEDFPPHLIGPWSKLRGYCARLGLIVHFLRWGAGEVQSADGRTDVDGESMNRAVRLVDYFKSHARKVYAVMDADPRVAAARRLVRWIVQGNVDQFTRRDAYRVMRGSCKTVDDIDPILLLLEKHGYIRPLPTPDDSRPGRKASPAFETHPSLRGQNGHNGPNPAGTAPEADPDGDCVHSVHSVQGEEAAEEWEEGEVALQ